MSIKRPGYQVNAEPVYTVPLRPIGGADLDFVRRAMADIAPSWSVELEGICADEATLVLLPEDGDDANGPSFMISQEDCLFRLDQVHWDVMTELGSFAAIADLVIALRVRLAGTPDAGDTAQFTIH